MARKTCREGALAGIYDAQTPQTRTSGRTAPLVPTGPFFSTRSTRGSPVDFGVNEEALVRNAERNFLLAPVILQQTDFEAVLLLVPVRAGLSKSAVLSLRRVLRDDAPSLAVLGETRGAAAEPPLLAEHRLAFGSASF